MTNFISSIGNGFSEIIADLNNMIIDLNTTIKNISNKVTLLEKTNNNIKFINSNYENQILKLRQENIKLKNKCQILNKNNDDNVFFIDILYENLTQEGIRKNDELDISEKKQYILLKHNKLLKKSNKWYKNTCIVCMETRYEIICIPCGHVCYCANCCEKTNNICPICNQIIVKQQMYYT